MGTGRRVSNGARRPATAGLLLALTLTFAAPVVRADPPPASVPGEPPAASEAPHGAPGKADLDERVRTLVVLLSGPESQQQASAELLALGPAATPFVLRHARHHDRWSVRWEVANFFGNVLDPRGLPALRSLSLRDPEAHVRAYARWALGRYPDEERAVTLETFREALSDPDAGVRWNAAVSLTWFGDVTGLAMLHEGVVAGDEWQRWEAIRSLGLAPDPRSVAVLQRALSSRVATERQEAALSLGEIGGDRAVGALLDALDDGDPGVRWRACKALGRIGDAAARRPLEALLLRESDATVIQQAEGALASLPPPRE